MSKIWTIYQPEYHVEMDTVIAYGVDKIENVPGKSCQSYKAQALRELCKRHILERKIKGMNRQINAMYELFDLQPDEEYEVIKTLIHESGMDSAKIRKLFSTMLGR